MQMALHPLGFWPGYVSGLSAKSQHFLDNVCRAYGHMQARRRGRVAGVTTPALLKTAGFDPSRNLDISVTFILKR